MVWRPFLYALKRWPCAIIFISKCRVCHNFGARKIEIADLGDFVIAVANAFVREGLLKLADVNAHDCRQPP